MSFKEVLGRHKYIGARNRDLNHSFGLESTNKNNYEDDLNYRVRGSEQFEREKQQSSKYRLYGRLNFIANLKLDREFKRIPTFENFNPVNSNTFDVFISYPASVNGEKGIKNLSGFFNSKNETQINFNNGLPLFEAQSQTFSGRERAGFLAFVGHNFNVNDIIEINLNGSFTFGRYKIIDVVDNYIYVESQPFNIETPIENREFYDNVPSVNSANATNYRVSFGGTNIGASVFDTFSYSMIGIVNNLGPQFYCKKIKKDRANEYYMRTQKIIHFIDHIYQAGFSRNYYNQDINLFNEINPIDVSNYLDNLGRPISNLYVGILKHAGDGDYRFSSVESNFSNLIGNTMSDEGIEQISDRVVDGVAGTPNENAYLLENLVEYDPDDLMEYEINNISHTFVANPDFLENQQIKFEYKPFYEVPIRKFSTYIESTKNEDLINLPEYTFFDPLYQKYRWRDFLDIGFFESNGNGIDYPFLNGSHYRYADIDFFVKNKNTTTYDYFDGSLISTEFGFKNDVLGDMDGSNNQEDQVFQEYNKRC